MSVVSRSQLGHASHTIHQLVYDSVSTAMQLPTQSRMHRAAQHFSFYQMCQPCSHVCAALNHARGQRVLAHWRHVLHMAVCTQGRPNSCMLHQLAVKKCRDVIFKQQWSRRVVTRECGWLGWMPQCLSRTLSGIKAARDADGRRAGFSLCLT